MSDSHGQLKVLHIDHTTDAGGAEFGLMRMLAAEHAWDATILLPKSASMSSGVYSSLVRTNSASVEFTGPAQTSGASNAGLLGQIAFGARVLGQALAVRVSPAFKTADVVHANTSRAAVYSAIASWGTRTALVVHLRDMVDPSSLGRLGFELFTRVALRRATGVIANSHTTLDSARPFLRSNTVVSVIPSAVGISVRQTEAPAARPVVQRVGMVARIDPWKGQDLLIRAFAEVFAGTDVKLTLAGAAAFGHDEHVRRLEDLAEKLHIGDQVEFLGHVEDVPALLSSFDICVQSSRRPEPLGQNVLQYLAAGKVVVATRQGGPGEWIVDERNGLLFEMNDLGSLVNALSLAHADQSLRQALSQEALRTPGLRTDTEVAVAHLANFRESSVATNR